ncbi:MAG TPA: hypothetical protein VFH80_17310 [Solirubrobacteraceae bacterium]|nr:hypothetical protein [Solirubrobacteraceae bacterium]
MKPRPVANLMRFRGPLAGSYPAAVALVVFALIPYLALSAAINPLLPVLSKSLPLSRQALELTNGMANAAYAFGTVMAVQFAVHRPGRRMLLLYAVLFVIGSVLAALAVTPGFFIVGHVLQGLSTSLMLIAAVPPLVIGWPISKMPWRIRHEPLRLRGGRARSGDRRSSGRGRRLASAVLDRRGVRSTVRWCSLC